MAMISSHRDLKLWQRAIELGVAAYRIARVLPEDERFALGLQLRRSAVSVASNVAEGFGRGSRADYVRFLRMARGSLRELDTQIEFVERLEYAGRSDLVEVRGLLDECSRMSGALITKLKGGRAR